MSSRMKASTFKSSARVVVVVLPLGTAGLNRLLGRLLLDWLVALLASSLLSTDPVADEVSL